MNILYLSCHEILEFDELSLLSEIPGVAVRSIGAYADPTTDKAMRPAIPTMQFSEEHMEWIADYEPNHILDRRFLDWADVIIYMHLPKHLMQSKEVLDDFKGPIIYRSIGQSSDSVEILLQRFKDRWGDRFKIIRYSPNEIHHINYAGCDGIIRFYKDSVEYQGWKLPDKPTVLMALQAAPERGTFGKFEQMADATEDFDRILIGPRNEGYSHRMRTFYPSYKDYKKFLQTTGVLFYGGMIPASYTLTFMEAMMSGMPIVALDKHLWVSEHAGWCNPDVYEVPELIDADCVVHSWQEVPFVLQKLLDDPDRMWRVSHTNRLNATMLFDKINVDKKWRVLLNRLG